MSLTAILAVVLPILLAFIAGLIEKRSQTKMEDAPAPTGVREHLDDELAQWKKENGAP